MFFFKRNISLLTPIHKEGAHGFALQHALVVHAIVQNQKTVVPLAIFPLLPLGFHELRHFPFVEVVVDPTVGNEGGQGGGTFFGG